MHTHHCTPEVKLRTATDGPDACAAHVTQYQSVRDRVFAAYPFGTIDIPAWNDLKNRTVIAANSTTCHIAAARGASLHFGENIRTLKGASKLTAEGAGCFIAIGTGTTFENTMIQVNGKGSAVIIAEGCRIRGLKIIVRRANSIVVIGKGTSWESGAILSESGNIVALGNDCMVSNSVIIRTSDGHTIFDAKTREPVNPSADVFIGSHVWLGNSARVNKGVRIGSGSVLGQCAIASGKLEGNSIYAGVPAVRVREGIVWSRTFSHGDIPEEYLI